MKRIKLEAIGEEVCYEKLENGLEVYLYNKSDCTNNYVTFTVKFGSVYNEFVPNNSEKMLKVPHGVAHFLEHKVFCQEDGPQPEEFFAKSGAICNAYTTFKNTTYLFSGPNDLKENTEFLLNYVQEPYFTEENVNSEKGIIIQEIHMCDDNPTDVLYEYIRKNTFFNNPFKDSIIGLEEDIRKISDKTLYTCYETFYHPENMFLIVTGNFNEEELLEVIRSNQVKKQFPKFKGIKTKEYKEPDKVVKKKEIVEIATPIPKVAYNLKISLEKVEMPIRKYNLYLFIIFSCLFDDTSSFDSLLKEENVITNSLYLNLLNCDSHMLISLINETSAYEKLLERIDERLKEFEISAADLERKKRVLISNELFSFENIEVVNEMMIDNIIFEGKLERNMIELLRSLNKEELDEVVSGLDLSNKSIVILKGKGE